MTKSDTLLHKQLLNILLIKFKLAVDIFLNCVNKLIASLIFASH